MFRMVKITAMWYSYGFNSMTYPIYIQQKFVQIIEHTNYEFQNIISSEAGWARDSRETVSK